MMTQRRRVSLVLAALAIALSGQAAPAAAANGTKIQKVVTKIVTVKPGKKPRPGRPVAAPEIGAEGAAAALLLALGGIAVMTGRRRPL